jgi:hypothetical protein
LRRCKQALAFEQLPGNGAGPDLRVQVIGRANPGDVVRVHAHAGGFDGAQVYVGDGGLVADAMDILGGPLMSSGLNSWLVHLRISFMSWSPGLLRLNVGACIEVSAVDDHDIQWLPLVEGISYVIEAAR